jgi:hypothetical protein
MPPTPLIGTTHTRYTRSTGCPRAELLLRFAEVQYPFGLIETAEVLVRDIVMVFVFAEDDDVELMFLGELLDVVGYHRIVAPVDNGALLPFCRQAAIKGAFTISRDQQGQPTSTVLCLEPEGVGAIKKS